MFDHENDIYLHIGQAMFNALPDEWDSAYFYFTMLSEIGACEYEQGYFINGVDCDFSVNKINGEYEDAKCVEAFNALYQMMKKNAFDVPWNKARFELMPDGNFDIKFKYDEDFAWFLNLDYDNKRDAEVWDALADLDVDNVIKSWEGLPENFDRYWLK